MTLLVIFPSSAAKFFIICGGIDGDWWRMRCWSCCGAKGVTERSCFSFSDGARAKFSSLSCGWPPIMGRVVLDEVVLPPDSLCSSSSSLMDGSRGALEMEEHFCKSKTILKMRYVNEVRR